MVVKVEVKDCHIKAGKRQVCTKCPIALAITEHIKEGYEVAVNGWSICIVHPMLNQTYAVLTYTVPDELINFIDDFDSRHEVEPFSFDLDIPSEFLKV